jgi:phosphinothricin acetyltransferase
LEYTGKDISKVIPAHLNDLDKITEILNQATQWGNANAYATLFKGKDRISWFKEHMVQKYAIYVFKEDRHVLGYVSISPYRKGREAFLNTAEVSYYVDFNHHRKGIASCMMLKAFDHCKEKKIKTLLAFLYNHNERSIAFLRKFGFNQWGLLPRTADAQGKEFDHVIYGKRIV